MKKLIAIMALSISAISFANNIPKTNSLKYNRTHAKSQQQKIALSKAQERDYKKLQVIHSKEQERFRSQIKNINREIAREKSAKKRNKKRIKNLEDRRLSIKAEMEQNQLKYKIEIRTKYNIYL